MIVNEVKKEINDKIKKKMTENQQEEEELRTAKQVLENDILELRRNRFEQVGEVFCSVFPIYKYSNTM